MDQASIGRVLAAASEALADAGFDDPRRLARRVMAAATGATPSEIFAHPERSLSEAEQELFRAMLMRVIAREPLSRIMGAREFWGLDFLLSPDTLDPRPETETLVGAVLARVPDRPGRYRILDLGTGSGCLLLALLSEYPNAWGMGVDIAWGAAQAARHNATRLGLHDRASFVVGSWAEAIQAQFDIVVANPPYIATEDIAGLPPEVKDHDPRVALDGGTDSLVPYRVIAARLPSLLAAGAVFATEIGSTQADAVTDLLQGVNLYVEPVLLDLAGLPRCLVAGPASRPVRA